MKGSIHEFAWMGSEDEPSKRYAAAKIYMRHLPNISQKQQLFHSFHSDISASRNWKTVKRIFKKYSVEF